MGMKISLDSGIYGSPIDNKKFDNHKVQILRGALLAGTAMVIASVVLAAFFCSPLVVGFLAVVGFAAGALTALSFDDDMAQKMLGLFLTHEKKVNELWNSFLLKGNDLVPGA